MFNEMSDKSRPLRKLLAKLDIKSANISSLEEIMEMMMNAYGIPDQLVMSPSVLDNYMEVMGIKKEEK